MKKERLPSCFCLVKKLSGVSERSFSFIFFWQSYCISHHSDETSTVYAELSQRILVVFTIEVMFSDLFGLHRDQDFHLSLLASTCASYLLNFHSLSVTAYPLQGCTNSNWHPDPSAEYCKAQKAHSEFARYFDPLVNRHLFFNCALCSFGGEILIRRETFSLIDFQAQLSLCFNDWKNKGQHSLSCVPF